MSNVAIDNSSNIDIDIERNRIPTISTSSRKNIQVQKNESIAQVPHTSIETNKIFLAAKKSAILATIVALSSIMIGIAVVIRRLITVFVTNGNDSLLSQLIQTIIIQIDCTINLMCLIATFNFSQRFINIVNKYCCCICSICFRCNIGKKCCLIIQVN